MNNEARENPLIQREEQDLDRWFAHPELRDEIDSIHGARRGRAQAAGRVWKAVGWANLYRAFRTAVRGH